LESVKNKSFAHVLSGRRMKVVALKEHKCHCCGATIGKGEECFAFFVNPSDPEKNEFDIVYTCSKCSEEEACRIRIRRKGVSVQ